MANDTQLKIAELFYSIQGESSHAGYPCFFIRFGDCNLRCTFCDTRYAYEEEHPYYSLEQVFTEVDRYPPGVLVEITGGEPLLQIGVYPLMHELLAAGRKVLLETNGSISLEAIPEKVIKIVDLKCPGSGMHQHMNYDNFSFLSDKDEVKFVLSSREDYEWAVQVLSDNDLQKLTTVTFSPVVSRLAPADLAGWILKDRLPARLRLQLHTIIWPDKKRGF